VIGMVAKGQVEGALLLCILVMIAFCKLLGHETKFFIISYNSIKIFQMSFTPVNIKSQNRMTVGHKKSCLF
jgi:hypothetical protein